ncbi:hypothetical protein [Paenibacillus sp. YN15]|uniref:hypothetical protein n=1 Tax=Paenibacillus sp. YN15 TaxID=1742774 RepID=UPI000DCEBB1D|nr:hypothetical protein [Paenibacillus sp. YN15]RAV03119.1 hypothetical protein DQG13_08710 [Paenibacillus sp. YN15]
MRKLKRVRRFGSFVIACAVAVGPMAIAYVQPHSVAAAESSAQSIQSDIPVIDSVNLNGSQSVSLSDISVYPDGKNNRVTFTLTFTNNSYTDLDFINYWVRLQSNSGLSYSVNLLAEDKDKNRITAQSSESFSFYANVGKDVSLQDLRFKLIQWDFSVAGYERTLGTLQIPADFTLETKVGQSRTVWINQIKTSSKAESMRVTKRDKANQVSLKFFLKNTDIQPLALPDLQFKLKTSNGLLYPLKISVLTKDAVIQPLEEKEGALTGSVPSEVSLDGAQLVITKTEAINNSSVTTAIAYYELLEKKSDPQEQPASEQLFMTEDGTYGALVNHFHRVPWEDKDIVILDVTVTNRGQDSLPVPQLGSYLMLDDSIKVESQNVRMDKAIALKPGQSTNIQVTGKVPYTYEFEQMKLVLQELNKEGDKNSASDLTEMIVRADQYDSPTIAVGDAFITDSNLMDKVSYTVNNVKRYSSEAESIYVAQVEVKNLEKRQLELSSLVGYFKMPDGVTVSAINIAGKNKVAPNGKAYVYFYTVVPEAYDLEGSSLIMGRAVSEGKLLEGETQADSYVNAVTFGLPVENKTVQDNLKNVSIGHYSLTLQKLKTTVDYQENRVNLGFDYQLKKELLLATDPATHKLEIEMVDPDGRVSMTQIYDLEKGGSPLLLGSQSTKISEVEENLVYDLSKLKKYTINIYDLMQVEGGEYNFKRLIASKKLDWFITSD